MQKLWTFTTLAYAFTWTPWGALLLDHQLEWDWEPTPWYHLAGGLGPLWAALLTVLIFEGWKGLWVWLKEKLGQFPWAWMGAGIGMPLLFFLFPLLFLGLSLGEWPPITEWGLNDKVPFSDPLTIWLLWCLFFGLGEEMGWRGFLFPEFTKQYSPRTATLFVAFIWAPWHLPVFFYDPDFMSMGVAGAIGWMVGLVFGSLLLGWLTKKANWSLWPAILWHGTFNFFTTTENLSPIFPGIMSALVILAALWIARRSGPDLE